MSGDGSSRTIQSYHDGILEVVGIFSSFHMAQLQVGLSCPVRLGQAKVVEVNINIRKYRHIQYPFLAL